MIQDRSRHAQAAITAYNAQQAKGPAVNVAGGTGSPNVVAANGTQTVRGSADVNIRLQGFPPGTRTTASTEGDLFNKPTIERAMPMAAAA